MRDGNGLATLRERAEVERTAEAWAAYRVAYAGECARRDRARKLNASGALALADRIGKLPDVVVESAEADDFGRAELQLTIGGKRCWTRPTELLDPRGYGRLRDAIASFRRRDWRRAYRQLARKEPPRSTVQWGGIDRVRFNRTQFGHEPR